MTNLTNASHIIEDSANQLWAVWPTNDADLAHVWYGFAVKKTRAGFVAKAKARTTLVRRECTKIVAELAA